MARRLILSTRAGQVLAVAACCLVLVTGCTRTAPSVPAAGDGGAGAVQPTSSATQSPTSPDGAGSGGGGGSGGGSGNASSEATGGDGGNGNQAAGSPIDVPTIPEKHVPMEGLRDVIKDLFVAACGGHDLCVKLEFGNEPCFVGYEPATRAVRGSTVHVLTESQADCDRANGVDGSGSTEGTTPGPSSETTGSGTGDGPTGNGQPSGSAG